MEKTTKSRRKNSEKKPHKTRRKLLAGGAAFTAAPILTQWGKPIINSVLLPAHAQTSGDIAEPAPAPPPPPDPAPAPPPPPPPPPPAAETFSLLVSQNTPDTPSGEYFVSVDDGTFSIVIFFDAAETDLSPRITTSTATDVGVPTNQVEQACANDGSLGPTVDAPETIQVVSYTPGVNVELQFASGGVFSLPLDNSAAAPSCPIL